MVSTSPLKPLFPFYEVVLRLIMLVSFVVLESCSPFRRAIHAVDLPLYSNPEVSSYVPTSVLWPMVFLLPLFAIAAWHLAMRRCQRRSRDSTSKSTERVMDVQSAVLCYSLALVLNGVITDVIKLSVGRPRPDFLRRCFPPYGVVPPGLFDDSSSVVPSCPNGVPAVIEEGLKSFPSGHASFAFTTFGFIFFYLSGKLKTFSAKSGKDSVRLLISISCIIAPTVIAISRTCDYHHHWQDVSVGSLLGFGLAWTTYRFYYPPLNSPDSDQPYVADDPYVSPVAPLAGVV